MIKGICIGILIAAISFLLYENLRPDRQIISQMKVQADSLRRKSQKSEIEYRDRIKVNTKIVTKWNEIRDTLISIDTLYLQAKSDINYLDLSLKKCDTALTDCNTLSATRNRIIFELEKNRPSKIGLGATAGVGVYSGGGQIVPALGITFGLTFKK